MYLGMIPEKTGSLVFNTKDIQDALTSSGEYKDDFAKIKKWTKEEKDESENDMFAVEIKQDKKTFLGIVNFLFQRDGYAINTYPNGDVYFGFYLNDLRYKQGFYSFFPKKIGNKIINEYYYGLWKDDLINGPGANLWLKLTENEEPFQSFEKANFTAYVGKNQQGNFEKGVLMSKENDNYFLYYGGVDNKTHKNGENGFYYCAKKEEMYFGTFKNNEFVGGYLCQFDKGGAIKMIAKYNKNENGEKEFIPPKKIDKNEITEQSKNFVTFRSVILSKDYFGILFKEFAKILKFRNDNMKSLDDLISDNYIKIMDRFSSFSNISIYNDIQRIIENK